MGPEASVIAPPTSAAIQAQLEAGRFSQTSAEQDLERQRLALFLASHSLNLMQTAQILAATIAAQAILAQAREQENEEVWFDAPDDFLDESAEYDPEDGWFSDAKESQEKEAEDKPEYTEEQLEAIKAFEEGLLGTSSEEDLKTYLSHFRDLSDEDPRSYAKQQQGGGGDSTSVSMGQAEETEERTEGYGAITRAPNGGPQIDSASAGFHQEEDETTEADASKPKRNFHIVEITAGVCAVIAIGNSVPTILVLTANSVAGLLTQNSEAMTFSQTMETSLPIRITAIIAGIMGTVAITPFSPTQIYRFVRDLISPAEIIKAEKGGEQLKLITKKVVEGLFVLLAWPSGALNAYTTQQAWIQLAAWYPGIDIGALSFLGFALGSTPGPSNGKYLFDVLKTKALEDSRYAMRLPGWVLDKVSPRINFLNPYNIQAWWNGARNDGGLSAGLLGPAFQPKIPRAQMLYGIRKWIDDARSLAALDINDKELSALFLSLQRAAGELDPGKTQHNIFWRSLYSLGEMLHITSKENRSNNQAALLSETLKQIKSKLKEGGDFTQEDICEVTEIYANFMTQHRDLPWHKSAFSYLSTLVLSPILAYFGNRNVYDDGYLGFSNLFNSIAGAELFGFSPLSFLKDSAFIEWASTFFAADAFAYNVAVWFFLQRTEVFQKTIRWFSHEDADSRLAYALSILLPAFCVGLTNVVITLGNNSLDPATKAIVGLASVLGTSALCVNGLGGNINNILEVPNYLEFHKGLSEALMETFERLDDKDLEPVFNIIQAARDSKNEIRSAREAAHAAVSQMNSGELSQLFPSPPSEEEQRGGLRFRVNAGYSGV
jgi:hypothetical protein